MALSGWMVYNIKICHLIGEIKDFIEKLPKYSRRNIKNFKLSAISALST